MTREDLLRELSDARAELLRAVEGVEPGSHTTPGIVGEWSVRELLAHLGYWAGHAVEAIHAAEDGRPGEHGLEDLPTEEVNATVARVARETDIIVVRKREAASFETLTSWLARMDASLLDVELGNGATVEQEIREDAVDHYREHAAGLRAVLEARSNA
jgi:hypothetical protein